ncbi:MAG: 2',5' RNA ligase family [Pelotomaculum sp. PtaU1.Bin035]|nr:MAG: 2',5' RNA ligase family [Pelotomaculum sp. PtaU1.Bin035]
MLESLIKELRQLPSDAKWVDSKSLHLTVQFLGNVPEIHVPVIVNALNRSVACVAPFKLNLNGIGVFPSIERPRVLWMGMSGETAMLSRLHHQVQKELGHLGFEPEKRRYSPHLTLARVRSPLGFSAVMERAEKLAGKYSILGLINIASIELMLSELSPRGPKYFVLARIPLIGPALVPK